MYFIYLFMDNLQRYLHLIRKNVDYLITIAKMLSHLEAATTYKSQTFVNKFTYTFKDINQP